jgi:tetratricopeptide (TPR) repeat protein
VACDQRWFAEAYLQIDTARRLYERLNDRHMAGRSLVKKSAFASFKGDPEAALRFLEEGSARIDPERAPELPGIILHNRILYLTDAGDHRTAQRLLFEARSRRALPTGEVNKARLRHVEGRIFLGLGQLARAAKELELATQELQALNRPLAAGIAGLDLAMVWLEQDEPQKVLPLAQDLVKAFRARGVRREALAAMMLVEQACREQRITIEFVAKMQEHLREVERNPRGAIGMPRG